MKDLSKKLLAPILSLFLGTIGNSFFGTLLSLDLRELGFSNLAIGGIVSIYYLGMMLGSWFLEKRIARMGFFSSYLVLVFLNILFIALFPLSQAIGFLYFIRFALGVVLGGIFVIVESWILLLAPPEKKGEAMSWYMIGLYSGASLGQVLITDTTKLFPYNFVIPIIACLIGMVVLFFQNKGSDYRQTEDQPNLSTKTVIQLAPVGFFGNLLSGSTLSVFYGLVPLYGKTLSLTVHQIGLLMGITIAGGFIGQWPIGKLSDKFSKDRVLLFNAMALSLISVPMLFGTKLSFFVLCVIMFLFGTLAFTLYPLAINSLCEKLPQNQTIAAVTKGVVAYGIGCVFGPILAPLFMEMEFKEGLFFYFLLNTGIFVLFFARKLRSQTSNA
ncbi:MAG: MFS transporter [Chlamydiae bacterium]|nr:MFS transporter [Chlamydiota bacterium]